MRKKLVYLKIIVLVLAILIMYVSFLSAKSVAADGSLDIILRIETDNVYFYSYHTFLENDKLFLLTKTYFLIGIDCGDYYKVEYINNNSGKIIGYVKKADVVVYNDGIPNILYPKFNPEITSTMLSFYEAGSMNFEFSESPQTITTLFCYGKLVKNNKIYMYIYYEGEQSLSGPYYVNYNNLNITEPNEHPIPLIIASDYDEPISNNPKLPSNSNNKDEIVQIIIILSIIIFAVVIVYFMFRPSSYKYKKKDE